MFAVIIFHYIFIGLILLNELARDLNNQILFFFNFNFTYKKTQTKRKKK